MLVYLAIVGVLSGLNTALQVCLDRVDPRTGVSDCPNKAALCANPVYQQIMWEQCPVTCGRCSGDLPDSGGVSLPNSGEVIPIVSGATCFDRVDPRTGVSDCPSKAALCTNSIYQQLMWEQCPLTCGRCPGIL